MSLTVQCTFGVSFSRFHCCGLNGGGLWPSLGLYRSQQTTTLCVGFSFMLIHIDCDLVYCVTNRTNDSRRWVCVRQGRLSLRVCKEYEQSMNEVGLFKQ